MNGPVRKVLPRGIDACAFKYRGRKTIVVSRYLSPARAKEATALLARGRGAFNVVMTRT